MAVSRRTLIVLSSFLPLLCLDGFRIEAAIFDQNATISQTNPDYIYFEAEWFDRLTSNSPNSGIDRTLWRVNFTPHAPANGQTIVTPSQPTDANPSNSLVTYSISFTSPGTYTYYAYRLSGGWGDSMHPPPDFDANPFQVPNFNGTDQPGNRNRWNDLSGNDWDRLGLDGDFPSGGYFATGAINYQVSAAEVGRPLEFRIGTHEGMTEFDRFALHKNSALSNSALNSLTPSQVVIGNPYEEQVFSFSTPSSAPKGGFGFMGLREVTGNGELYDQTQAQASLANGGGTIRDYTAPVLNLRDAGSGGHFGTESLFATDLDRVNSTSDTVNHVALLAQGTLRVPPGKQGNYTFGVSSDDGFTLTFPGRSFISATNANRPLYGADRALQFFGTRGPGDSFGVVNLPAGDHPFYLTYHEGIGGAAVELYAAQGAYSNFNSAQFRLVGQTAGPIVEKEAGSVRPRNPNAPAGTPPWDVTVIYDGAPNISTAISQIEGNWNGTRPGTNVHTANAQVINYFDPEGTGGNKPGYTQTPFPGDLPGANQNNYALGARTRLTIEPSDAGVYTFMVLSDDSFRFRILGTSNWTVAGGASPSVVPTGDGFQTAACCEDAFGATNLVGGTYDIELIMNEMEGGSYVGVWATKGLYTTYNDPFQLLGENIFTQVPLTSEGLQLVPEPAGVVLAAIGIAAAGVGFFARTRLRVIESCVSID